MAQKFYAPYFKVNSEEDKINGSAPGYYIVLEPENSPSERFFISAFPNVPTFEKLCSKVLSDAFKGDWWVARSFGFDINGDIAWSELDCTEKFV